MQIVIICGGEGKRLGEISKNIPKGLIMINKKPFMEYLINSLIPFKPNNIHFCLGKFSDQYLEFLSTIKIDINFTYSIEDSKSLLGTGGAIKNSLSYLQNQFIVQYGDTILDIDYTELFNIHKNFKKDMTMTISSSKLTYETPNLICKRNKENFLDCMYDKKLYKNNGNYIDYGALVFNKNVFQADLPDKFDLSLVQSYLSKEGNAFFHEIKKRYIEIGTEYSLKNAKKILKNV